MSKPTIPQGTRDFDAATLRKRYYIFNTIKQCFEWFGFEPLETPAMENLDTLMGKYGDEGDKLIFKILNNGLDRPEKREKVQEAFEQVLQGKNTKEITERALRYDLTIPFARFVAMNHQQLTLPYKRYQLQPVWRADRPQKGRYREFYQCDADVVGTESLQADADFVQLYDLVFTKLNLPVTIHINNRKILAGLAEICEASEQLTDITIAIDKLDKIGKPAVLEQIAQLSLPVHAVDTVDNFLSVSGSNSDKLHTVGQLLAASALGTEGVLELQTIVALSETLETKNELIVDFTLARGLNYYTGAIFEIKAIGVAMGSIGGGGRYNDLTGLFGVKGIAGIGISFGLDRIYDCMEELQLFPQQALEEKKVMFLHMGDACTSFVMQQLKKLRLQGIIADYYHQQAKLDKQFKYAERKGFGIVVIIGPEEMEEGTCQVKNLSTGNQEKIAVSALAEFLG